MQNQFLSSVYGNLDNHLLTVNFVVSHFIYAFSFIGVITIRRLFVYYETLRRSPSRIFKNCSTSCQPAVAIFTALSQLVEGRSKTYLIYQFSLKHKIVFFASAYSVKSFVWISHRQVFYKNRSCVLRSKSLKNTCDGVYF